MDDVPNASAIWRGRDFKGWRHLTAMLIRFTPFSISMGCALRVPAVSTGLTEILQVSFIEMFDLSSAPAAIGKASIGTARMTMQESMTVFGKSVPSCPIVSPRRRNRMTSLRTLLSRTGSAPQSLSPLVSCARRSVRRLLRTSGSERRFKAQHVTLDANTSAHTRGAARLKRLPGPYRRARLVLRTRVRDAEPRSVCVRLRTFCACPTQESLTSDVAERDLKIVSLVFQHRR